MPRSLTSTATIRTARTPIRATATRATAIQTARTAARRSLGLCVEPVDLDRFRHEFWERRPLVVPRSEEGRFDDLLSRAETERLIAATGLRYPALRLVKAGEKIGVADYTETISWRPNGFTGSANVERVTAAFERGATIVLQALHIHHLPLAEFCRSLEADLGHPVQANAYYTPRAAQGLAVHHDTHDVFCLQVAGEKRWLVYEPVLELPLKDQRYSQELGEPGEPVLDVTLTPGDTLYLPRGWLHQALTSDTDSLHLTVGVNTYTGLDAVRAALEEAAREEVELRRAVSDDGLLADDLLALVAARLRPQEVTRRRRERFVSSRRPIRGDQFDQLRGLEELDAETYVERRETVIFELQEGSYEIALVFEGRRVAFPLGAAEEVKALAAAEEPVRVNDLPGRLDEAGRMVLVRRLIREGFLRISGA